jgi:hypothetical protein
LNLKQSINRNKRNKKSIGDGWQKDKDLRLYLDKFLEGSNQTGLLP